MRPFSAIGDDGTTLSSAAVPPWPRSMTRLQFVSATSDKAGSILKFLRHAAEAVVTAASAAGQKVVSTDPTGFAADEVVMLWKLSTNQAARAVVASVDAEAGTITMVANLPFALAPGDKVFLMAEAGRVPVGAATKEINSPTVFAADGPALVEIDGTAACKVALVSGEYV
ncbi:MAG: hypothetical protein IT577_05375 [Verrucomicrobiae bacterium]|nr:hypothetical protein [Verrucomicrobiae bacterium]